MSLHNYRENLNISILLQITVKLCVNPVISDITMAWRVLELRMENTASRYKGQL